MAETQNSPNFSVRRSVLGKSHVCALFNFAFRFLVNYPFRTVLGEDMISETQKLTYPFTLDSRFQVSNQNGSVQIVGDDINEVRIEATKKARSQSELAAIRISVEQKENAIVIKTIWDNPCRRRVDIVGEELRATLGSGKNPIQLRTVNGTIRIQTKG
jgi:hypothetical protein